MTNTNFPNTLLNYTWMVIVVLDQNHMINKKLLFWISKKIHSHGSMCLRMLKSEIKFCCSNLEPQVGAIGRSINNVTPMVLIWCRGIESSKGGYMYGGIRGPCTLKSTLQWRFQLFDTFYNALR